MPHKDKNIKQLPRFCKYIKCRKLLPKDAHHQKRYCQGTKCFYLQNQLEAAERRKANKKIKIISKICNLDGCDNEFEVSGMKQGTLYCSEKCRKKKHRETAKEYFRRHNQASDKIEWEMVEGVEKKVKKLRDSGINPRFLVRNYRGYPTSNQIGTMVGMNA